MTRKPVAPLVAALVVAAHAPAAGQSSGDDVRPSTLHDYRIATVVNGLVHPWGMAFLPGGEMLVTERPGRLRIVRDGALDPAPVEGVPAVHARGQGGLLDVVLHPDFEANRLVYLSYSKPLEGGEESTTGVVRGRLDGGRLVDVEEVFEARSRGRGHYGSRLGFHPDGHLFITVGDRQVPSVGDLEAHPAQDLSNHHGTVLRLRDDGRVPGDNPFVGREGARPEIWSYGHRNPQGLAIDRETGDVWITEHGPQGGDELNVVLPGRNYGWPVIGYGVNYGSGTAIHAATRREGMEQPVHFWVPSIATSGLMLYTGDRFPRWRGDLFAGGLAGRQLARLEMEGREVVREETLVLDLGRIRAVRQGPDGYIYLAIDGRDDARTPVVRLEPVDGG